MPTVTLANLARMTTATVGTGTITLGSAADGCLTFAQAGITDGQTVSYGIEDGDNSEVGRGVYTSSGTTLSRSVLRSTNSNNPISLSGTAEVFIIALAEDIAFRGARVKKASDQTGADYTTSTALSFDTEVFDVGGWFDGGAPTRLTVPSGVNYVEVFGYVGVALGTADTFRSLSIRQDGSTVVVGNELIEGGSGSFRLSVASGPIAVTGGTTYFELLLRQETDNSITVEATNTFFSIRAVG